MIGRRRDPADGIFGVLEEPGDYVGPIEGYTGDKPSVFFRLPVELPDRPGSRSIHHVASPPHTFRECEDGSLKIRESILSQDEAGPIWHGYLDCGHEWRTVP